jgi:hypothetical protein
MGRWSIGVMVLCRFNIPSLHHSNSALVTCLPCRLVAPKWNEGGSIGTPASGPAHSKQTPNAGLDQPSLPSFAWLPTSLKLRWTGRRTGGSFRLLPHCGIRRDKSARQEPALHPHTSTSWPELPLTFPPICAWIAFGKSYQFPETIGAMGRAALPARDLSELRRRV